jgi:hypothetical protein
MLGQNPHTILHELIKHRLLTNMMRTRAQAISQLFKAQMWFKYTGRLQGMWPIRTGMGQQIEPSCKQQEL